MEIASIIDRYKERLGEFKGEHKRIKKDLSASRKRVKELKQHNKDLEEAHLIIQTVAKATQQQLEYHVAELVTLALEAVFDEPYKLNLDFKLKRKQSEAILTFSHSNGQRLATKSATGGGVINIAAFALRISLWHLQVPRSRATLVLDEPFKDINDPSRELHKKAAQMIKMIADKLRVQLVIVTLCPELREVADKIFEVSKQGEVSTVKELKGEVSE